MHWPFYCEENIWHLCAEHAHLPEAQVCLVTGHGEEVAMWAQRQGRGSQGLVAWDYHVLLVTPGPDGWQVHDPDSQLGCPVSAAAYAAGTWPDRERVRQEYQPRFRVMSAAVYRREFRSNREHMRKRDGSWHRQPPPWPLISADTNLDRWLQHEGNGPGEWLELDAWMTRFGAHPSEES